MLSLCHYQFQAHPTKEPYCLSLGGGVILVGAGAPAVCPPPMAEGAKCSAALLAKKAVTHFEGEWT